MEQPLHHLSSSTNSHAHTQTNINTTYFLTFLFHAYVPYFHFAGFPPRVLLPHTPESIFLERCWRPHLQNKVYKFQWPFTKVNESLWVRTLSALIPPKSQISQRTRTTPTGNQHHIQVEIIFTNLYTKMTIKSSPWEPNNILDWKEDREQPVKQLKFRSLDYHITRTT